MSADLFFFSLCHVLCEQVKFFTTGRNCDVQVTHFPGALVCCISQENMISRK